MVTAAGFTFNTSNLTSNTSKTAYNSSTSGVYVGTDGIGLGTGQFHVSAAGAIPQPVSLRLETVDKIRGAHF